MFDTSDFMCSTYNHILAIYAHICIHMAYMLSLACIFVSGTHLAVVYEADVAVSCILVYIYAENVGFICPYNMLAI